MKINTILALGLMLGVSSSNAATIHVLGHSDYTDPVLPATPDLVTPWGTVNERIFSGGVAYSLAGVVDGESFTYDVTLTQITAVNNAFRDFSVRDAGGNLVLGQGNGNGVDPTSGSPFNGGDEFSITISNISNPIVVLDGLINFSLNNIQASDGLTINGTSFLRDIDTNGDTNPGNGVVIDAAGANTPILPGGVFTFTTISPTLESIAYQFSIPEPSSTLLLGLGSLFVFSRRQRK